ncbi:MAG: phage holin family protein [Leucobacter sp.]
MSRRSDQAGTFELLAKLPHQIVTLAKIEFENAKQEVVKKAKKAGIGAVAIIVALFFVFFALEAFVVAAIAGIAVALPVWLAALIVAGGLLALAAAAILAGVLLMKRGNPIPGETLGRVEGDLQALSEVRVNAEDAPRRSNTDMPQAGGEGNWR